MNLIRDAIKKFRHCAYKKQKPDLNFTPISFQGGHLVLQYIAPSAPAMLPGSPVLLWWTVI